MQGQILCLTWKDNNPKRVSSQYYVLIVQKLYRYCVVDFLY
ncbi:MAG: hypothetical protein JETT_3224 [Candidatus Jettenia ecosi]|uniref:Uncharacterized protein n=1 Tax=Candidatus Jettenia ecosi TaxID=2494326 RepID=A0A533QIW7_9BACT|nr:MAG: hypothetical protein JETT_3224 [Candidatus Jettenia ecosi]